MFFWSGLRPVVFLPLSNPASLADQRAVCFGKYCHTAANPLTCLENVALSPKLSRTVSPKQKNMNLTFSCNGGIFAEKTSTNSSSTALVASRTASAPTSKKPKVPFFGCSTPRDTPPPPPNTSLLVCDGPRWRTTVKSTRK